MAKKHSIYICQNCSFQTSKWMGKCPECNQWNTFQEEVEIAAKDLNRAHKRTAQGNEVPKLIKDIDVNIFTYLPIDIIFDKLTKED